MFLRSGYAGRLDATTEDLTAPLRVVNAGLPFAQPIMPVLRRIDSYRAHDRRKRILDRMARLSQRAGLYDNDF